MKDDQEFSRSRRWWRVFQIEGTACARAEHFANLWHGHKRPESWVFPPYTREVWSRESELVGPERRPGGLVRTNQEKWRQIKPWSPNSLSNAVFTTLYSFTFQSKSYFSFRYCGLIPLTPTFSFINKYAFMIRECEIYGRWLSKNTHILKRKKLKGLMFWNRLQIFDYLYAKYWNKASKEMTVGVLEIKLNRKKSTCNTTQRAVETDVKFWGGVKNILQIFW